MFTCHLDNLVGFQATWLAMTNQELIGVELQSLVGHLGYDYESWEIIVSWINLIILGYISLLSYCSYKVGWFKPGKVPMKNSNPKDQEEFVLLLVVQSINQCAISSGSHCKIQRNTWLPSWHLLLDNVSVKQLLQALWLWGPLRRWLRCLHIIFCRHDGIINGNCHAATKPEVWQVTQSLVKTFKAFLGEQRMDNKTIILW